MAEVHERFAKAFAAVGADLVQSEHTYEVGRRCANTPAPADTYAGGADMAKRTCSIDSCTRAFSARGWCKLHYERWRRHGDPEPDGFRFMGRDEERFWAKVDVGHPLGCWEWTAGKTAAGYGTIRFGGRPQYAHRVAFELLRGPIQPGRQIDHLCRNRGCVNPDHLEPVTHAENVRRGYAGGPRERSGGSYLARRTHCKHGHPLSGDNVRRQGNARICRSCARQRIQEFKARQRGAA